MVGSWRPVVRSEIGVVRWSPVVWVGPELGPSGPSVAGLVVLYEFPVVRSGYPEVVDSDKHVK